MDQMNYMYISFPFQLQVSNQDIFILFPIHFNYNKYVQSNSILTLSQYPWHIPM